MREPRVYLQHTHTDDGRPGEGEGRPGWVEVIKLAEVTVAVSVGQRGMDCDVS